jgi:hypothetical protein
MAIRFSNDYKTKSSTTFEFVFDDWDNSWALFDFDDEQSGNSYFLYI